MFYEDVPAAARFSCWPVVAGFSFTTKLWGVVLIESLAEVSYNSEAFDKLVLPAGRYYYLGFFFFSFFFFLVCSGY